MSDDDSDVTGIVDHVTVRNAEEAEMYSHRKKIAEKLLEKEKKYLYYLRCLEKIYNAFHNNARLRNGCIYYVYDFHQNSGLKILASKFIQILTSKF